jgi:hypothetical protein
VDRGHDQYAESGYPFAVYPRLSKELAQTAASTGASIPQLMLGGAIMMEISIAMIILSRVLKYGINRWVNIVVASSS